MTTIAAGQRADADRVNNLVLQDEFTPSGELILGAGGSRMGRWRLMNTWVSGWAQLIFGTTPFFDGFIYPPIPIDETFIDSAYDVSSNQFATPIGFGRIEDSDTFGQSELVLVLPFQLDGQIVLRFRTFNTIWVSDPGGFEIEDGDSLNFDFAYPAAAFEFAGRRG